MALLKITNGDGGARTISIDLTNMNPTVSVSASNPLIAIEPPNPSAGSATAIENFNAVVVNLAMFAARVNITFVDNNKTWGGFGVDPFNMDTLATNFQKLMYLFQIDKTKKKLYINHDTNYIYVQIASFRVTNVAGQKDLMNFSLDLIVVGAASL